MELKNLSSNWKKLQQKFSKDDATPNRKVITKKRAAPEASQNGLSTKRVKLQNGGIRSRGRMAGENGSSNTTDAAAPSASLALWAEDNDIPAADLAEAYGGDIKRPTLPSAKTPEKLNHGLSSEVEVGKYISMDCEMVGVGPDGEESALARVSIVNFHGEQVYDSFVQPKEYVTDWRTSVSGIAPKHMPDARSLEAVQKDVVNLLDGRILVGHAVHHDLEALFLSHPRGSLRDTSRHAPFRKLAGGRTPGLRKLSKDLLGIDIQGGEHSSVEDARACMLLFRRNKDAFEADHAKRFRGRPSDAANGGGEDADNDGGKSKTTKKKKKKRKN
ncbi:MAG: 3'-5' exonuclease [Chaenotheca gracillima]|nr:MAG: 3'-5' exonuclease [Chaenotheca gracillima]